MLLEIRTSLWNKRLVNCRNQNLSLRLCPNIGLRSHPTTPTASQCSILWYYLLELDNNIIGIRHSVLEVGKQMKGGITGRLQIAKLRRLDKSLIECRLLSEDFPFHLISKDSNLLEKKVKCSLSFSFFFFPFLC